MFLICNLISQRFIEWQSMKIPPPNIMDQSGLFFFRRRKALLYKTIGFENVKNNIKLRWGTLQAHLWLYCWFQFASIPVYRHPRLISWKSFMVRVVCVKKFNYSIKTQLRLCKQSHLFKIHFGIFQNLSTTNISFQNF